MERMKNTTAKKEKEDPFLEMLIFWNNYQKYLFTDTKDVFSLYPASGMQDMLDNVILLPAQMSIQCILLLKSTLIQLKSGSDGTERKLTKIFSCFVLQNNPHEINTYLSNILHHKTVGLNFLEGFHSPASAVVSSEDAKRILCTFLYYPIRAVRTTPAKWIAFIDGQARLDFQLLLFIVSQNKTSFLWTALLSRAVWAFTASCYSIYYIYPRSRLILVNVIEVYRRTFKIHSVFYQNHSFMILFPVEFFFPSLQSYSLFSLLHNVICNCRFQSFNTVSHFQCSAFFHPR